MFKFKANMQRHERNCGLKQKKNRKFQACKFCGKEYSRPVNCKNHMRVCLDNPDREESLDDDEEEEAAAAKEDRYSSIESDSNTE
jgi:hypothetical protein